MWLYTDHEWIRVWFGFITSRWFDLVLPPLAPPLYSLVQVADDIFEELVVLPGEAPQNIPHGLKALLPIIDLWKMVERDKRLEARGKRDEGKKNKKKEKE